MTRISGDMEQKLGMASTWLIERHLYSSESDEWLLVTAISALGRYKSCKKQENMLVTVDDIKRGRGTRLGQAPELEAVTSDD